MQILTALTYYRPYVSGLTVYVERLARAWARAGHQVTVLTSQYSPQLPTSETQDGVRIVRVPVVMRLSKGVVMPSIGAEAERQIRQHEIVSLHLPQFDAAGIAIRARRHNRPVVLTYHCDVRLPPGFLSAPAMIAIDLANRVAGATANAVVAYTEDYALHSPFLARLRSKLRVIPPPVETVDPQPARLKAFREGLGKAGPHLGMAARLATEKGVEYLLAAMPQILRRYPEAQVLFAGQHQGVLGEGAYARRLAPAIQALGDHWRFLGVLEPAEMAVFFETCDVTVLPSLNSTESFGLVQIESMLRGTPVVASDLPGVRQPVRTTGMGRIIPLRSPDKLAEAILDVLEHRAEMTIDREALRIKYAPSTIAAAYTDLFQDLLDERSG